MFSLTVVISIAAVRVVVDRCGRAQTHFDEVSRTMMHNRLRQNATLVFRKVDERRLGTVSNVLKGFFFTVFAYKADGGHVGGLK